MVTFGRVLLWTVVLVAPGGFLLVPVLAAAELGNRGAGRPQSLREQLREIGADIRGAATRLQRYWTKS
ncbi:MAG TPA: hypothetical protein VHB79_35205 [Polyangiaceae bacterium]|nr:hypothetical protein [Polyangiaceae bacterium]